MKSAGSSKLASYKTGIKVYNTKVRKGNYIYIKTKVYNYGTQSTKLRITLKRPLYLIPQKIRTYDGKIKYSTKYKTSYWTINKLSPGKTKTQIMKVRITKHNKHSLKPSIVKPVNVNIMSNNKLTFVV